MLAARMWFLCCDLLKGTRLRYPLCSGSLGIFSVRAGHHVLTEETSTAPRTRGSDGVVGFTQKKKKKRGGGLHYNGNHSCCAGFLPTKILLSILGKVHLPWMFSMHPSARTRDPPSHFTPLASSILRKGYQASGAG